MKITSVLTHRVNLPLVAVNCRAPGIHFGAARRRVTVRTDEGLTGWGEAAAPERADVVDRALAPCRVLPEIRALANNHNA